MGCKTAATWEFSEGTRLDWDPEHRNLGNCAGKEIDLSLNSFEFNLISDEDDYWCPRVLTAEFVNGVIFKSDDIRGRRESNYWNIDAYRRGECLFKLRGSPTAS